VEASFSVVAVGAAEMKHGRRIARAIGSMTNADEVGGLEQHDEGYREDRDADY